MSALPQQSTQDEPLLTVRIAPVLPPIEDVEPPAPAQEGPVEWVKFLTFPNALEGHIVGGRLNAEGVPTRLLADTLALDGWSRSHVFVPKHLLHRANWVLAWPPVSEEELAFLATGELEGPPPE